MERVNFSKLQKFEESKKEMNKVFGGKPETVGTGTAVYANGEVHQEYCTGFDDGSWHIWFD